MTVSVAATSAVIFGSAGIGLLWAFLQYKIIAQTEIVSHVEGSSGATTGLLGQDAFSAESGDHKSEGKKQTAALVEIHAAISEGAEAFLHAEYRICLIFCFFFACVIMGLVSWGQDSTAGALTMLAFILGALTSIISGYIGMKVAVFSNVRTAINAQHDNWEDCFNCAFRAGSVLGFCLTGMGLLVLYFTMVCYKSQYGQDNWSTMMDCIAGFGLGGSTIAMFGRVGGGIYTKAADVGADLVGKVVHGIPEDDPRNPATIADNVGDNVGDVAGMGADLFGSFAESTCAALVIAAQTADLRNHGWGAMCFPLIVTAVGMLVCLACSFIATHIYTVSSEDRIELVLRLQLIITTVIMVPVTCITIQWLPEKFDISGVSGNTIHATNWDAFACVVSGAMGGLIIGLTTEYYTSKEYAPVLELAESCRTGAATNIIYGLALGYKSVILPVSILAAIVYICFDRCDMYGIALGAVGMLSNLATGLTIDAYGPVCDNAGGIAEMAELRKEVRRKTDALDAAGNTTAAVGKGFAIGSAALVSLALFGAFVTRFKGQVGGEVQVEILKPVVFAFLLVGAMLPFWFSAMTMKSVGKAAMEMVFEVERQFKEKPELLNPGTSSRPDYRRCVEISTKAALREMVAPAALIILAPLITGTLFGVYAVFGLLTGSLLSSVQLAVSMSNTGGAWDNAKKYVESNKDPSMGGKGSDIHKAAVVGDTVGDPLKDTSGPALNIVMKLMAIISLVFAGYFYQINDGKGGLNVPTSRRY
jgi:H(+)-translocating pyrophosphatase